MLYISWADHKYFSVSSNNFTIITYFFNWWSYFHERSSYIIVNVYAAGFTDASQAGACASGVPEARFCIFLGTKLFGIHLFWLCL